MRRRFARQASEQCPAVETPECIVLKRDRDLEGRRSEISVRPAS